MPNNEKDNNAENSRLASDSEIKDVFEHLGLSTYEQRARYLNFGNSENRPSTVLYTTRLSNNSGINNAESLK